MSRSARSITVVALALLWFAGAARGQQAATAAPAFARSVDLAPLGAVAVHQDGRLKSFDSFARSMMQMVTGPGRFEGQSDAFTYLDLIMRNERYLDADLLYVKKKPIRARILTALQNSPYATVPGFSAWAEGFMDSGMISRGRLATEPVVEVMADLNADLVRTAKFVQMLETAVALTDARRLLDAWRIVPPANGDVLAQWSNMGEVMNLEGQSSLNGMDAATRERVLNTWISLVTAWRNEDAAGVNGAVAELAGVLPTINTELYPSWNRLAWESWYFKMKNLVWVWLIYAFALVPLTLSLLFRWRVARWLGVGMFLGAFGMQTFALLLRWYVSQRWPNTNMFEAVTTACWFGGVAAILLEIWVRKTRMRGLFILSSAVASMIAFMAAHYYPLHLDPNISNRMPVLFDVWLYIHTNVIIFSYCLIFMAAVTACAYLGYRLIGKFTGFGGPGDFARVGGAGSLIVTNPEGGSVITSPKSTFGQVLDGTTMVLMELSFIMLWAGLVMGAIWADHSWGRPWGWDPKEVFALNTFLVFAVLVHGRIKVKDKGMWTAVIALVGAGVMLFNWIAINFVITGLHSYA